MKRLIVLFLAINLYAVAYSQEIPEEVESKILSEFKTSWFYFRMQKNPLMSYEETHNKWGGWKVPYDLFVPEIIYERRYGTENIKVSRWGEPSIKGQGYVDMRTLPLFLVEKGDGMLYTREDYFTKEIDTIHINVYDSIFPYDNRFLVSNDAPGRYTLHGGNVEWSKFYYVRAKTQIDYVGYVRGVQFGVDLVKYFNEALSERIRQARPDFPDYVYTEALQSMITTGRLLIGAPKGKEDQLIEFIYYSKDTVKTGDPDKSRLYEIRYVMPTEIKSISERRWEKRKLSDEEMEVWYTDGNPLRRFEEFIIEEEPEIIIKEEE